MTSVESAKAAVVHARADLLATISRWSKSGGTAADANELGDAMDAYARAVAELAVAEMAGEQSEELAQAEGLAHRSRRAVCVVCHRENVPGLCRPCAKSHEREASGTGGVIRSIEWAARRAWWYSRRTPARPTRGKRGAR